MVAHHFLSICEPFQFDHTAGLPTASVKRTFTNTLGYFHTLTTTFTKQPTLLIMLNTFSYSLRRTKSSSGSRLANTFIAPWLAALPLHESAGRNILTAVKCKIKIEASYSLKRTKKTRLNKRCLTLLREHEGMYRFGRETQDSRPEFKTEFQNDLPLSRGTSRLGFLALHVPRHTTRSQFTPWRR